MGWQEIERARNFMRGDSALVVEYLETKDINKSISFVSKAATVSATKFGTCEVKRSEI